MKGLNSSGNIDALVNSFSFKTIENLCDFSRLRVKTNISKSVAL